MINVAIINPSPGLYSQTFISAHLNHINANKFVLKKGFLPVFDHKDKKFYDPILPIKIFHKQIEDFVDTCGCLFLP